MSYDISMSKPLVFMFSGQGSHYYHMGKELFEQHPGFRKWMHTLDTIVCDSMGESIVQILYDKKSREQLKAKREEFVLDWAHLSDGRASERIVSLMKEMIEEKTKLKNKPE